MSTKQFFLLMFICCFDANNACNLTTHFLCSNKRCLHRDFVCDGHKHCGNSEDENNCDRTSIVSTSKDIHTTISYLATTNKSPSATTNKSLSATTRQSPPTIITQQTDTTFKTTISPCHVTPDYTHKMAIVHENGSILAASTGENVNFTLTNTECNDGGVYNCRVLYSKETYSQHINCNPKFSLKVNEVISSGDAVVSVDKGSNVDIQCGLTQADSIDSGRVDGAPLQGKPELCEGDATENCWVIGYEMSVAIHILNCSICENSCQVKGHRSCLHVFKNETSFQDAKTQCAQLGGVVAGPSVYMDQDGCILNQLAGVTSLFSSDSNSACLVYSSKKKSLRQCKSVQKLPFGCLVPSHDSATSPARLTNEMIAIIVGGVFILVFLCGFCIVYTAVRVGRKNVEYRRGDKSTYDAIALANRNIQPIYSTIDEHSSDVYSTGCCHCVRTKPAPNGKNLTPVGGPPAPHLPPRKHSPKADVKHVQLHDQMKFDTDSSIALQSTQHAINLHQERSKTSKCLLQKVVPASTAGEADRQSFICDSEGYLKASHLHTECITTQDGGLDKLLPCCQQYEDQSTDYITPVECEYDVHMS